MFERIPILRRWKLILGFLGFGYLFALLYGLQVWAIYGKMAELKIKTRDLVDADFQIVNRQVELKILGEEIGRMQDNGRALPTQAAFIGYLDSLALKHDVSLVKLPESVEEAVEGFGLLKSEFQLEGAYQAILRVLHEMENRDRIGSMNLIDFELKPVRIHERMVDVLICTVVLNRLTDDPKGGT